MNLQPRDPKAPTLEEFEAGVEQTTGKSNRIQESFVHRLLDEKRGRPAKTSFNKLVGIVMEAALQEHVGYYIAAVGLPHDSDIKIDRILDRIASKSLPAYIITELDETIETYICAVLEANEGEKFVDIPFEYDESIPAFSNLIAFRNIGRTVFRNYHQNAFSIIDKEIVLLEAAFRFLYRLTDTK